MFLVLRSGIVAREKYGIHVRVIFVEVRTVVVKNAYSCLYGSREQQYKYT